MAAHAGTTSFTDCKSDQRVYVEVCALPNGVGRRERDDAVADAGGPADVAADMQLDPGRCTRGSSVNVAAASAIAPVSPDACKTTETDSVASPRAARL